MYYLYLLQAVGEQPGPNADGSPATTTFTGHGKRAASMLLNPSLARFAMTHDGKSNFSVVLYDKNGGCIDLLANEIGAYNGSASSRIDLAGVHWITSRSMATGQSSRARLCSIVRSDMITL
jgi:hypothetical protein